MLKVLSSIVLATQALAQILGLFYILKN